jgi:hypothetical protein
MKTAISIGSAFYNGEDWPERIDSLGQALDLVNGSIAA